MPVPLSYVSEAVFAAMVNRLRERLHELPALEDLVDPSHLRACSQPAATEVPLRPYAGRVFDGASRVDVVARLQPSRATAFELKLGMTRMTAARVDEEWLRECTPSHGERRWSGNMMAILDRRFPDGAVGGELEVRLGEEVVPIGVPWFVVVRRRVLRRWETTRPAFGRNARLLAFEDFVELLGGKEQFNDLVRPLFAFDYYERWLAPQEA